MTAESKTGTNFSLEKSIRYRLFSVMLPLLAVLIFVVHQIIHLLLDEVIVDRLKQDSESLISAVTEIEGEWQVDKRFLPHVYHRVKSGHYYILQWSEHQLRSRSLWDKKVDVSDFEEGDTDDYLYHDIAEEKWVIHKQEFIKKGQEFHLWVAEDVSGIDARQTTYEIVLWFVLAVFFVVFVFWQRRTLQVGFARLEPIQKAIRDNRMSGELNFPDQVPLEIKSLVDSISLLVERSSEQIARSRMSVGNLAHELKRPLQDLSIITSSTKDQASKERLQWVAEQLKSRIDSELRRARISGSPMPGSLFSFVEELPHLQQLLDRIHHRTIHFDADMEEQTIPFDRDDMIELLGNLLDNAWKYADSNVCLTVRQNEQQWSFVVEDNGPGISQEKIDRANQRGVRIDEETDREGNGLGLSICQSIVESYGGTINFERSDMGGLMVKIYINKKLSD